MEKTDISGKIKKYLSFFNCYLYEKFFLITGRHIKRTYFANKKRIVNFDKLILKMAKKMVLKKNHPLEFNSIDFAKPKILILNTEIYDSGGHTEVAMRFIESFKDELEIDFCLTVFTLKSEISAPVKSQRIKNCVRNYTEFNIEKSYSEKILDLYIHILKNHYTTILVNIHMHDVVACAALGLLKEYSDINIIAWNHADHLYSLGMDFADVILTRNKNGKPLTPYIKNKRNFRDLYFLEKSSEIRKYTKSELNALKKELNIPENAFVTISGADYSKFGKDYFKLIKKILKNNENVWHVFVCSCGKRGEFFIDKYSKSVERFVQVDFVANFDKFIQISDLFIDSFPQGSALTLIDFIKHSKPVIIKINEKEPIKSFETYLSENYEYSCKTPDEMYEKICTLISNNEKYEKAAREVREFYEQKYNIEVIKRQYREILK